jgi:hypothetical protein
MISQKTRSVVWARAAGRCQYAGCNKPLIGDLVSGNEDGNFGFIAHIVAEAPGGPRGHDVRSHQLVDDPANLMLTCYPHHKLIDVDDVIGHPEDKLLEMKAAHERRIDVVSDIDADRASHVLRYGARIGLNDSPVAYQHVRLAILPEWYPADGRSIGIEILGSVSADADDRYWTMETENLRRQFELQVRPRIASREITHLSVFALAPIPLLVELGRLLCDIVPSDVYQLHREPAGWRWARDSDRLKLALRPGKGGGKKIALKVGLSASVADDRIRSVLGVAPIWAIEAAKPGNDVLRYPEDLAKFRRMARVAYSEIRAAYGSGAEIHVFPATPVAASVELGRVWMPKADLPLVVYDETRGKGFVPRLEVRR